jgi:hypothetical protein
MKRIGADVSDNGDEKKKKSSEGGGSMELESELRTALGLGDDADVLVEAKKMFAELEPLRKASIEHDKKLQFAEQYPEEAKRLAKLEERDRENSAKRFAETVSRFKVTENDKEVTKGFSARATEKIEEFARSFSERTATLDDLGEVLTLLPESIVEYGERGSSRSEPVKGSSTSTTTDARKLFAEIVSEIAIKDEKSWADAVSIAAATHPDEFEAYQNATHANVPPAA